MTLAVKLLKYEIPKMSITMLHWEKIPIIINDIQSHIKRECTGLKKKQIKAKFKYFYRNILQNL